jgi:8-oxo-dGTP pyrophosphatase MutT (NUDIX family)
LSSGGTPPGTPRGIAPFGPETLELLGRILPADDRPPPDGELRPAAVLVPLFLREDIVHVVLTKRTDNVRTHQGQVSFPGGSYEEGDRTLRTTALRESEEEVGLRPDDVRVLGVLDDLPTFVSGFLVRPFVGAVPHPYEFVHDVTEVDHVFTPPLDLFADPSRRREEMRERDGKLFPMVSFDVDGNIVWGATARMLIQLVERIQAARV